MEEVAFFTGIKVSAMNSIGTVTDDTLLYVVQGGQGFKGTAAQFKAYLGSSAAANKPVLKDVGASCPVVVNNFQACYAGYNPRPDVRRDNGDDTFTYYNDAQITVIEVAGQPNSILIDVANDGTGHLADKIRIIFKPR